MAVIAVTLAALDHLLDEPLRRQMEHRLTERLRGYAVTLRGLDFHIVGGSVDLLDLIVVQAIYPRPLHLRRITFRAGTSGTSASETTRIRPVSGSRASSSTPGGWHFDGRADFLADPHPGLRAHAHKARYR